MGTGESFLASKIIFWKRTRSSATKMVATEKDRFKIIVALGWLHHAGHLSIKIKKFCHLSIKIKKFFSELEKLDRISVGRILVSIFFKFVEFI